MTDPKELGEFLQLNSYDNSYNLPVYLPQTHQQNLTFLLIFRDNDSYHLVKLNSQTGRSQDLGQASRLRKEEISAGLAAVPWTAMDTVSILGLPKKVQASTGSIRQYLPHWPQLDDLLRYDPYRYTKYSQQREGNSTMRVTSDLDRDYEQELNPFALTRDKHPQQIPLNYPDPKTGQTIKIFVRGWYLFDHQPPLQLSWKPSHTRKSSWRTSHIFIDKVSQQFFFQGEVYRGKYHPVFLEQLTPASDKLPTKFQENWDNFLNQAKKLSQLKQIEIK